ncbi:MAG: hypothetical protein Q7S11_01395 [bacterium]|nr:hypothetical protein [bacterium]
MTRDNRASKTTNVIDFEERCDDLRRHKHRKFSIKKRHDLEDITHWGEILYSRLAILVKKKTPYDVQNTIDRATKGLEEAIRKECESHLMPDDVAVYGSKYIAHVIIQFLKNHKTYVSPYDFLSDTIEKREWCMIRKNAELCFLIYTIFPNDAEGGSIKRNYYCKLGVGLYEILTRKSPSLDDLCMADCFVLLSCVTRKALTKLNYM